VLEFAIQTEVAQRVQEVLQVKLLGGNSRMANGSSSPGGINSPASW